MNEQQQSNKISLIKKQDICNDKIDKLADRFENHKIEMHEKFDSILEILRAEKKEQDNPKK